MLNHAGHHNIDQVGKHFSRVADGLMTAQLDHAGTEVLGMAAQLFHCGFKGHAGSGGGLLEDHPQGLSLHQRRIVACLDALLDLQGQMDHVQQFLLCEVVRVDKVSQCFHDNSSCFLIYNGLYVPTLAAAV